MRLLILLSFVVTSLGVTTAKAQPTPTEGDNPPETAAAEPAADPEVAAKLEETPVDAVELVSSIGHVINDWKNVGWLAGVIALINLLLSLLRFRPIDMALDRLDWKWLKPLIATLLGAALGGFSTFQTGAGVLNSIVAGMLAGLGSVGFHELVDNLRKQTRKSTAPTLTTTTG
jgi:hypothetical protein